MRGARVGRGPGRGPCVGGGHPPAVHPARAGRGGHARGHQRGRRPGAGERSDDPWDTQATARHQTGTPCADFSNFTKGDAINVISALAADTPREPRRRARTGL